MKADKPGTVLAMPEEFEEAALFLQFGLLSGKLICHKNGAFRKRSSNRLLCVFVCTENILKPKHYKNHDIIMIMCTWYPCASFTQMIGQCGVFKFLCGCCANFWRAFREKPSYSNSSGVMCTLPYNLFP